MDLRKPIGNLLRRTGAVLLGAVMLLGLAGCGGDDGPEPVSLREEGPAFTVSVAMTPDSMNPMVSSGGIAEEFFLLCYDPLWRINAQGLPESCLAEDWSLSSDRLTWTIRLRRDAVFSDGVPVTSRDVMFSYDLMRRNKTVYSDYFDGVTAIRCPDDYTVVISTEYVKGDMLYNPTPVLPKHIWQDYEFDPASFDNAAMIGSGPFVYDTERSGEDGWYFRSREEYFAGAPKIAEIFFCRYGTVTGAARAVSAGEADASFGLSDVQLTTLESVPGVELIQAMLPGAECRMLVLNTRSDFFKHDGLRQMAEYCTDREWFLSMSSGGAGMTGSSFMSPGLEAFAQPGGLRSFDQQRASEYLAAASYKDVDEDGILEYGTREKKLTLTLYTSSQDDWASTAATIFTEDMLEIGVQVNWYKTDKAVADVCKANSDWDMCFYTSRGGMSASVSAARFKNGAMKLSGWEDQGFDSILVALSSAEDTATEQSYARQLQQLVYDACPVVVLSYGADIQAIRSDLWTGFEDQLSGSGLFNNGSIAVFMNAEPRAEDAAE